MYNVSRSVLLSRPRFIRVADYICIQDEWLVANKERKGQTSPLVFLFNVIQTQYLYLNMSNEIIFDPVYTHCFL